MSKIVQCSAEAEIVCSGNATQGASANSVCKAKAEACVLKEEDPFKPETKPPTQPPPSPQENFDSDFAEKVLGRLYECRKIEIEHLWHRSVFLGAFIILAFTGYGALVGKMLEKDAGKSHTIFMAQAHFAGVVCGCTLLFLGILWICMAKGSKRWQELYERKIVLLEDRIFPGKGLDQFRYKCEFRQLRKRLSPETEMTPSYCDCKYCNKENCSQKPDYGKDLARSKCFLSLGPGPYSPSKINVMLGWFICLSGIWIVWFHYGCLHGFDCCSWMNFCQWIWQGELGRRIISIALGILLVSASVGWLAKNCKSFYKLQGILQTKYLYLKRNIVALFIFTICTVLVIIGLWFIGNKCLLATCIAILIFFIQLVLKHKLDENDPQK